MTGKRFTFFYERGNEVVFEDNGKRLSHKQLVDLLNTLHQENQQLKHYKLYEDNKRLQTIIAELKKENEQLNKKLKWKREEIKALIEESERDE